MPTPASSITATTTFGRNFITKSTTLPPNTSTYYQAYYPPKHLTLSSPSAAASCQTYCHHGYLSPLSNANYASHYSTHLTNPSAYADAASTHLAITLSNVDTSTRSLPTTQSTMVSPPLLHLSFPQPGTFYPRPNLMLNHSSTYPLTHMPTHLIFLSTQTLHPRSSSTMPALTPPLALTSPLLARLHAWLLIPSELSFSVAPSSSGIPPEGGFRYWFRWKMMPIFRICKTHQNGTSSSCRTGFRSLPVATYGGSLNKEKGVDGRD